MFTNNMQARFYMDLCLCTKYFLFKIIIIFVLNKGCWKGTWGTNCTTDCPDECIDRHCFPNNGSCVWGCDVHRCFHGECDSKTDLCTNGCLPGRGGRYCTFCKLSKSNK